jgi:hypothetical protein
MQQRETLVCDYPTCVGVMQETVKHMYNALL